MKSEALYVAALRAADPYKNVLSRAICDKIELAYIAQWLYDQDPTCLAAAYATAVDAVDLLKTRRTAE